MKVTNNKKTISHVFAIFFLLLVTPFASAGDVEFNAYDILENQVMNFTLQYGNDTQVYYDVGDLTNTYGNNAYMFGIKFTPVTDLTLHSYTAKAFTSACDGFNLWDNNDSEYDIYQLKASSVVSTTYTYENLTDYDLTLQEGHVYYIGIQDPAGACNPYRYNTTPFPDMSNHMVDYAYGLITATPDPISFSANSRSYGFIGINVSEAKQQYSTTNGTVSLTLPDTSNSTVFLINSDDYLDTFATVETTTGTEYYNFTGLYETLLTINVTQGTTSTYIQNHTTNVTGTTNGIDLSETTTNYTTTYELMFGDYSIESLPVDYSLINQNISIAEGNTSPTVTLNGYARNTFVFSIYDEITAQLINQNISIELISDVEAESYYTSNGSLIASLLTPSDYTIRYKSASGTNYTERDYYQTLQNLNYYPITLYDIKTTDSTIMLVKVVDTGGDAIEGAEVQLRRYYSGSNSYEVVEMAKTSYSGEAFLNADAYDGHYKLAVEYNGRTLLTTTPENYVPNADGIISKTITFNTGTAYYETYTNLPSVDRNLTYNSVTGALSFAWNDPNDLVNQGCVFAEYPNGTIWSSLSNCQNSSNGNVVLVLPDPENTTYRYYANLHTGTNYSTYTLFAGWLEKTNRFDFGAGGAVLSVFVIGLLAIGGAFMSAIASVVLIFLSSILVVALNLLPLGWTFITGLGALIVAMAVYVMRN